MDCTQSEHWMAACLDGELDPPGALQLATHLAGCATCRVQLDALERLRADLMREATRHAAPSHLRQRIEQALREQRPAEARGRAGPVALPRRWPWAWINLALAGAGAAAFAVTLSLYLGQASPAERLDQELVASHFRALMPDHLADVVSTDQHTVKPWFAGKLDFSPPVRDLAQQGYPLLGGRLDYIGQRPVAALVYGHRKHILNLYLWPAPPEQDLPALASTRQGYQLLRWRADGMEYAAVSDLAAPELAQFARQLRSPAP